MKENLRISRCGKTVGFIRKQLIVLQGEFCEVLNMTGNPRDYTTQRKKFEEVISGMSAAILECDANKKKCGGCHFGEFLHPITKEKNHE